MAHTKGPWTLKGNHVYAETYYKLCPPFKNQEGETVDDFYHGLIALPYSCGEGSQQSNARLIAAAPDLLAALERLVRLCPSNEGLGGHAPLSAFYDVAFYAKQALAKAKGGA